MVYWCKSACYDYNMFYVLHIIIYYTRTAIVRYNNIIRSFFSFVPLFGFAVGDNVTLWLFNNNNTVCIILLSYPLASSETHYLYNGWTTIIHRADDTCIVLCIYIYSVFNVWNGRKEIFIVSETYHLYTYAMIYISMREKYFAKACRTDKNVRGNICDVWRRIILHVTE